MPRASVRPRAPSLAALNQASADEFREALAPLFEGAPGFLGRLASERPFTSWDALLRSARDVAHRMPERDQVELLDAHPPIGAATAAMSALSRREQGHAAASEPDLAERLRDLNERYERRFGFRFVIFVAGRSRAEIAPLLEAALVRDRAAELRRGLDDVVAIAGDRLRALGAIVRRPTIGG